MKKIYFQLLLWSFTAGFSQNSPDVDFTRVKASLHIQPSKGSVSGNLTYELHTSGSVDSLFLDAVDMTFEKVSLNGEPVSFENDGNKLWIKEKLQPSQSYLLGITYSSRPKKAMYFIKTNPPGHPEEYQVWTQGQGKNTSNWLPSFDDYNEKVEFDLSIIYKKGYTVSANGMLLQRVAVNDSLQRWDFDMTHPISSYLVAVAAGDYIKEKAISGGGVPMEFYLPSGQEELMEPTYRYSEKMMDFLEMETGVPFPWQMYKQVPVRDFLYSGMENAGMTIFSDMFLVDSIGFHDRNYVMVNAHELAHQWFGDLVTAASEEHHWLQEGFATYYALLAEREVFGEDYFHWKLFQSAEALKKASDQGKGEAIMKPGAGSLTVYQKGAWALHVLKERVGKPAFDAAVKAYLQAHAYQNVTTRDFLHEVETTSGIDLTSYKEEWLMQKAFKAEEALAVLMESDFIQDFLEVASLRELPLESKRDIFWKFLEPPVNDYIGQEIVHQLAVEDPAAALDLYQKAFRSENRYVRQAIAISLNNIPDGLKKDYENLLKDDSYVTKEAALYHLWVRFPMERQKYLGELEGLEGFMDKNIRMLWLALSIATPGNPEEARAGYLKELSEYSAPHFRFQVRQQAFGYLFELNALDEQDLHDLILAAGHHNSRFKKFARQLLHRVLESSELQPELRRLIQEELGILPDSGEAL